MVDPRNTNLGLRRFFTAPEAASRQSRGFTLIDVLISLTVVAVLIGLLLPGLSRANETARRVACGSNVRQLGVALVTYAEDFRSFLPPSTYLPTAWGGRSADSTDTGQMVVVRLEDPSMGWNGKTEWDGLGLLFQNEHLNAGKVFYCPSHRGNHPFSRYSKFWNTTSRGRIVSNYHYRGRGPGASGRAQLFQIDPAVTALIADGMRSKSDYNHRNGMNFLRADLAVNWFSDPAGQLASMLPDDEDEPSEGANMAWNLLDHQGRDGNSDSKD